MRPTPVDVLELSRSIDSHYYNASIAAVNDHEIRVSIMTEAYHWHEHPESDETFLSVDGGLVIEFPDREFTLRPGQLLTVPAGTIHRTRPVGTRSVNLTFERANASSLPSDKLQK